MAVGTLRCPYVGLKAFREADQDFFFGRDRDVRVISSNLQSEALNVLYGPSGVGKSSVLQAGVVPQLRKSGNPAVVYFMEWQAASFLNDLTAQCLRAVAPKEADSGGRRLDDILQQSKSRLLLLLDQFEEYLLYHPDGTNEAFDAVLARIVNREDVGTKVLIGIREDALSKLDQRFSFVFLAFSETRSPWSICVGRMPERRSGS